LGVLGPSLLAPYLAPCFALNPQVPDALFDKYHLQVNKVEDHMLGFISNVFNRPPPGNLDRGVHADVTRKLTNEQKILARVVAFESIPDAMATWLLKQPFV